MFSIIMLFESSGNITLIYTCSEMPRYDIFERRRKRFFPILVPSLGCYEKI